MPKPRLVTVLVFTLAIAGVTLAGCGASGGGGLYGSGGNSPAPTNTSSGSSSAASVGTASATVNGKSVTILTDSKGKTLYYYQSDTATTSACTSSGGCASEWPPLLSPGGAPTSTGSLSGTLAVISDANGMQVTYNGHPLYYYVGDTSAGMTNGEGINNFFVATTSLAPITSSSGGNGNANPTKTPCIGYGCY